MFFLSAHGKQPCILPQGRMLSLRIQSRDITAAKRYNSYKISIASPKLKNRYFCSTATL